jgi:RND family efflux transporter MFP subunit
MIHSSLIRRTRPVAALCLIGGLTLAGCQEKQGPSLPPSEGPGAPPPAVLVTPAAATPADQATQNDRASTGTLRARQVAALGPKETGVITALTVDEGDRVKKGQLLFRLDSVQVALAVDQAKAAVASANVQASAAQTEFDRIKALRERGSVTPDVFDQAKARLDGANSMVVQANAAVDMASHRLTNMVVTSPIDGIVTEKRMNLGETATLMPPSIVLVIQDIDLLELRARLPEAALKAVREGSVINVRFPSLGDSRQVSVKRIAPTVDPRTRTIEIIADVDNHDHRLLAGMLVEVAYDNTVATAAEPSVKPPATAHSREKSR